MSYYLPPLRLTGARILRNGLMQRRSLGLARGRLTKGPLPEVDLTGYLVLPGIVDLNSDRIAQSGVQDLTSIKSRLARDGVTTAWLAIPAAPPTLISQVLERLSVIRGGIDLRAKLILSPEARLSSDLLHRLEELRLDFACFESLEQCTARDVCTSIYPRDLCRMAECFDALGIPYGSLGDANAETREYYRMLGACFAEQPRSRAAAATAHAMGDPVIACAADLRPSASMSEAVRTARLLTEGLCDALVSNGQPGVMAEAAWSLANGSLDDLPAAWAMISSRPAELIGLADRGTLDHGKRADLVIVDAMSRTVAATIAKGRLCYATVALASRFGVSDVEWPVAAE